MIVDETCHDPAATFDPIGLRILRSVPARCDRADTDETEVELQFRKRKGIDESPVLRHQSSLAYYRPNPLKPPPRPP
jgi:hypothetical protein